MAKKSNFQNLINTVDEIITTGRNREILHLFTEDNYLDGKNIIINNKNLINFGSCSYLGLEVDERLKENSISAVQNFGTQFSCSRTYLSISLYEELENLLQNIFNQPLIVSPNTTLGHQAVIPIVVDDNDAVILDQQAHYSMQDAVEKLQLRGIATTKIRHSNLSELENKILELTPKHNRIWYFIDGVYSMFGDLAPVKELTSLMTRYNQLYLYADDAHGMSWAGKNGSGALLSQMDFHPKMVMATSLAKGFGSAGGVFLFPNEELYWRVKNWGGPLTHSGPQQPAVIGASIASAKIHLSQEIETFQNELTEKVIYCNQTIQQYGLPIINDSISPIFFIGLGLTKVGYNMVKRLSEDGYYVNLGIFPAVPETKTGIRFTITRHHTFEDIENLIKALAYHLPRALKEEERSINDINRAFKRVISFPNNTSIELNQKNNCEFQVQHETSITNIPKKLWNEFFKSNESFDWDSLYLYEKAFNNNKDIENNWDFHYYIIRNKYNEPIISTFLTHAITKDDMLSDEFVSQKIENERLETPLKFTSNSLILGTLITEGQHIFINKNYPTWKSAFMKLIDEIWLLQDQTEAENIILRDFDKNDHEINEFLRDQGFVKIEMPDTHLINNPGWTTREEYIKSLNSKKRVQMKKDIIQFENQYSIKNVKNPSQELINKWYELYNNVRQKSFRINSFKLPKKYFELISKSKNWDCIQLSLKKSSNKKPIGIMLCHKKTNYSCTIIGIDYNYLYSHKVYKQTLFQSILKGIENKAGKIFLGFTTDFEKRKLGATAYPKVAYVQMQDDYKMQLLNLIPKTKEEV